MIKCLKCSKELNGRQKFYCSNFCKLTHKEGIKKRTIKKDKQDHSFLAKCKLDGKLFLDVKNYSGALSKHLVKLGVNDLSNVFDHYDIVKNELVEASKWNCTYCDWSTIDTKNKSGCITNHIKTHGIQIQVHMDNYPKDSHLWVYGPLKEINDYVLSKDENSFIVCLECGNKFKRLTKTHLKFHNLTPDQYRDKHKISILTSESTLQKFRDSYKEHCDKINTIKKISKLELEFGNWLKSLGIKIEYSNRKIIAPYELDLYLPDYKLAIEINGLYWHSEYHGNKHKNYHLSKLEMCEKIGVYLIQIFDDEWISKQSIIKSKILSKLKMSEHRIYARKCEILEVKDKKIKSEFLKNNHLQSDDRSKIAFGLYHQKELVALMTFGPLRRALGQKSETGRYELIRYCTSKSIVGGASKLFNHFLITHNPVSVLSYADRRFTSSINSTLYDNLGFNFFGVTPPNYWYTKDFKRKFHRFNFTKGRLVNKFNGDKTKSEISLMRSMGYDRVWDCGNLKYVYPK